MIDYYIRIKAVKQDKKIATSSASCQPPRFLAKAREGVPARLQKKEAGFKTCLFLFHKLFISLFLFPKEQSAKTE